MRTDLNPTRSFICRCILFRSSPTREPMRRAGESPSGPKGLRDQKERFLRIMGTCKSFSLQRGLELSRSRVICRNTAPGIQGSKAPNLSTYPNLCLSDLLLEYGGAAPVKTNCRICWTISSLLTPACGEGLQIERLTWQECTEALPGCQVCPCRCFSGPFQGGSVPTVCHT